MLRKGGLFRIARKLSSSIREILSKALNGFARLNELNLQPETFVGTWLQSGLRLWSRVQNRRQKVLCLSSVSRSNPRPTISAAVSSSPKLIRPVRIPTTMVKDGDGYPSFRWTRVYGRDMPCVHLI